MQAYKVQRGPSLARPSKREGRREKEKGGERGERERIYYILFSKLKKNRRGLRPRAPILAGGPPPHPPWALRAKRESRLGPLF